MLYAKAGWAGGRSNGKDVGLSIWCLALEQVARRSASLRRRMAAGRGCIGARPGSSCSVSLPQQLIPPDAAAVTALPLAAPGVIEVEFAVQCLYTLPLCRRPYRPWPSGGAVRLGGFAGPPYAEARITTRRSPRIATNSGALRNLACQLRLTTMPLTCSP